MLRIAAMIANFTKPEKLMNSKRNSKRNLE